MGCDCGKPKCDGHCGISPAVLQINNPSECVYFHRVEVPASMGDSTTNPPKSGAYKNVLLYYEADQTSWLYSSDGVPQKLVNGITNYEDAINLPQINGVTLLGDKNSADLNLADAPMVVTIASGNTSWSGADTAEDVYNFFLNKGKVNILFSGWENHTYEIASAGYIEDEGKLLCVVVAASTQNTGDVTDFDGNALFGTMALYTAGKAVDVSQIELQPKLYIADFTGLSLDYNELSGLPATTYSIGMVKPGDGLSISSDGTLAVIDHVFDTVADMKQATNLVAGSSARTLGYHTINDNGGGLYKIRAIANDDVIDEGSIVALDDGTLVAELIIEHGDVIVNQFGAKGDNATDDSMAIQNAINYSATIGLNSILLINEFYYCASSIVVSAADFRIYGRPACEYTSALRFDDDVNIGIDVKNYGFRLDNISIRGTNLNSASTSLLGLRLQRPTGGGTSDEIEAAMNIDADITNCIFLWLHEAILAKGRNVNVVGCDFTECENGFELDYLASGHSHRDIWIRDSRFHDIGANKRGTGADYAYGFAIIFPSTWVRADIYGNIIRNNFFDYCNNVFTGCILGCTISDNNILDCLHNGIVAVNPGTGAMTSNNNIEVMISNNNINIRGDQSNYGIYLKGVSRPRIIGNVIANQPTIAVLLETCGTIWFVDNSLNCIRTDITENLKIIGASGDEVFLQGNLFSRFSNNNNTFVNISGVSKVYTGGNVSNGGSTAIVSNVTPLKQGEDAHFW